MKFGSVCSGIEAASVAFGPLGWSAAWLSEIEPFPSAVLAHHYPDVPNLGDMTTIRARIQAGDVEAPDLFCGGTPCQSFSVAGLRRSLEDARGNLSLEFIRIADAIDDVRRAAGQPPAWILWENVPGVLSTADNAFGAFLGGLGGCASAIPAPVEGWPSAGVVAGPGRVVAWRVLDAQHFGVAQRRKRVFVLALAGARGWAAADALLPISDRMRWHPAPSREAGEGAAVCPTLRAGGNSTGGDRPPGTDVDTADSLQVVHAPDVARCLTTGEMKRQDWETCNFVAFHHNAQADQLPGAARDTSVTDALTCSQGAAVAFSCKDYGADAGEVAPTLRAMPHHGSHANGGGQVAVAVSSGHGWWSESDGTAQTLRAQDSITKADTLPIVGMRVRRLTPVECERLQGFPDGYTAIPWRTWQEAARKGASYEGLLRERGMTLRGPSREKCPDGPRYKALGNSWAVPCVRWIGRQIDAVRAMREAA